MKGLREQRLFVKWKLTIHWICDGFCLNKQMENKHKPQSTDSPKTRHGCRPQVVLCSRAPKRPQNFQLLQISRQDCSNPCDYNSIPGTACFGDIEKSTGRHGAKSIPSFFDLMGFTSTKSYSYGKFTVA